LNYYVKQLEQVTFHDKIGSMSEKMTRTGLIAHLLAQKLHLSDQQTTDILRSAQIYKFDLVTDMVGEFAELQGVMGEKYANIMGESPAVAQAIREHYLPTSAKGGLPKSVVGAVLALADKIESIMSFFAVDLIPNGSNDPYGLRRQALGIVRILQQQQWHLDLHQLQDEIVATYQKNQSPGNFDYLKHQADFDEFITDRIRQLFSQENFAHYLIDTVVKLPKLDPTAIEEDAKVLSHHQKDADFKDSIEALTRVLRITSKSQLDINHLNINPHLFQSTSE
ncbi:glycine--tRNA ligase subunit beta, partial [Lactobacillus sp. XV13L]|nr:glycine--tRNA ligase subunit beta [Lactobacillus sp. XV13L]